MDNAEKGVRACTSIYSWVIIESMAMREDMEVTSAVPLVSAAFYRSAGANRDDGITKHIIGCYGKDAVAHMQCEIEIRRGGEGEQVSSGDLGNYTGK